VTQRTFNASFIPKSGPLLISGANYGEPIMEFGVVGGVQPQKPSVVAYIRLVLCSRSQVNCTSHQRDQCWLNSRAPLLYASATVFP
jgi:hypothetical protein